MKIKCILIFDVELFQKEGVKIKNKDVKDFLLDAVLNGMPGVFINDDYDVIVNSIEVNQ